MSEESPTNKKRVNYSKEPQLSKMKQALQTAQSQEKPNLNIISQQFGVSRKALSDRYSGSIALNASEGIFNRRRIGYIGQIPH